MTLKGNKNISTRRGDISKVDYVERLVRAVEGNDVGALRETTRTARVELRGPLLPFDSDEVDSNRDSADTGRETDHVPVVILGTESTKRQLFRDDKDPGFGLLSLVLGVVSLIMFWVDVISDVWLVYNYYETGHPHLSMATLGIVVVSSLVSSAFGLHWYFVDFARSRRVVHDLRETHGLPDLADAIDVPRSLWIARFLITALQMGTVLRTIECLYYGWHSARHILCWRSKNGRSQRRLYGLWYQYEEADLSLLRLLEAFLESAPQLVFQLVIWMWLRPMGDVIWTSLRVLGILSSWVNLAQAIQSFHSAQRFSCNRRRLTLFSSALYVVWRSCEVASRVIVLSLFTLIFYAYVLIPVGIHFVIVFSWLMCQRTRVYRNNLLNTCFMLFASYVMVFCFLNLREGFSRWRYSVFYVLFYLTNIALFVLCWYYAEDSTKWVRPWAMYALVVFFLLHLVFFLLYYKCFHPSGGIRACIPCRKTFWESVGAKRNTHDPHRLDPEELEEERKLCIVADAIKEKQQI